MRKVAGWTLVELLVVVAIMSIMLALMLSTYMSALGVADRAACLNFQRQLKLFRLAGEDGLEFRDGKPYLGGIRVVGRCYDCHPSIP